jgi:hypothetical protein
MNREKHRFGFLLQSLPILPVPIPFLKNAAKRKKQKKARHITNNSIIAHVIDELL